MQGREGVDETIAFPSTGGFMKELGTKLGVKFALSSLRDSANKGRGFLAMGTLVAMATCGSSRRKSGS
jgi:hypothetical protein